MYCVQANIYTGRSRTTYISHVYANIFWNVYRFLRLERSRYNTDTIMYDLPDLKDIFITFQFYESTLFSLRFHCQLWCFKHTYIYIYISFFYNAIIFLKWKKDQLFKLIVQLLILVYMYEKTWIKSKKSHQKGSII